MLEIKNTGTEMKNKNASDGIIRRLDMGEERISELQATTIETTKAEKQRERKNKNKKQPRCKTTEYPRTARQLQKVQRAYNGNTRRERGRNRSNI